MPGRRVSVIGLDGLSWTYLNKLLKRHIIPNIKSIISKGVSSKIYAFPPNTPPSWSSIMTGVNPGKHGIYDFIHFTKNYEQVLFSSEHLMHPRVFEMLGFIGKKINCYKSYTIISVV
ncbi:MAG: alkaline phosphatase family protein [Thermoprotei archaeon]